MPLYFGMNTDADGSGPSCVVESDTGTEFSPHYRPAQCVTVPIPA